MPKEAGVNLTCRQCGREFAFTRAEQEFYEQQGFTSPRRCKECRSSRQTPPHHLVCSQCGTELEKGATIYCTACLSTVHLEFELKTRQSQEAANAAHTRLLAAESQKAQLAESLRQKEQLAAELEVKVNTLSQDLDKAYQVHAALGVLQPALDGIQERLEALEHAHNKISERMLQLVQKMHEMNENASLLEIIKRSLRRYQDQST